MDQPSTQFTAPNAFDRFLNRAFGFLVKLGLGLSHNYMLEVRGRKSGRIYSTPVNVMELAGKRYLVAPRGYTQWVKNVLAGCDASLTKGSHRETLHLQAIPNAEKPAILKAYLDNYKLTVQRYFPLPAGSPVEAFQPLVERYPVFQILPVP